MKNLKKTSKHFSNRKVLWINRFLPIVAIIIIVCSFFWRTFVFKEVPLPGDFIVGVYYPWLDYKWGHPAGVPVKNPITTDVVSFTYPMQTLAMRLMKERTWPLWNPYILAGTTLLANFQSAPFAPTRIVYFLFNQVTAWSLDVILQHILAALFTYILLRHWKVSKLGAVFGGVAYAFSGYNLIFSEWNGHTLASAFLPLALLFEDRLLSKKRFEDGFFLSVTLALQFFSGYTQTSVYTAFAIAILWFVRVFKEREWFLKTFLLGFFCIFGILFSSIQILPSLELMENSQRVFEPHPFEWAFLPWKKTITFVAPDYFGNHTTGNYWGPQDYTSNTGFVGVVSLCLALFALLKIRKRKEIFFLFLLSAASLALSYPTPLSIFIWSHNILGMQANSAHRATSLFCAAIAFLAGFGLDFFMGKARKLRSNFLILFPTYLLMAAFGVFAIYLYRNPVGLRNLIFPFFILLGVSTLMFFPRRLARYGLFVLMVVELFRFGWKFEPISPREFTYPTTPVLQFLQSQEKPFRTTGTKVIPSNLRMAYGIEAIEGYDTFHPLNVSQFIAGVNSGSVHSLPVGRYGIVDNDVSSLLDLVNTKYYLALKDDSNIKRFDKKRFKEVFEDKSVVIFESKLSLPRAFMVFNWEIDDGNGSLDVLGRLMEENFPFGKKILLDEMPNLKPSNNLKSTPKNLVLYTKYQNQESEMTVTTESDGMLFISDAYYPGWKAFVDGIPVKIYKADFAFRAVEVVKGTHIVKMVYEPESFYSGLKISFISFGVLFSLLVGKRFLRRYT